MWVFDTETLRFLTVNDAAVARYGARGLMGTGMLLAVAGVVVQTRLTADSGYGELFAGLLLVALSSRLWYLQVLAGERYGDIPARTLLFQQLEERLRARAETAPLRRETPADPRTSVPRAPRPSPSSTGAGEVRAGDRPSRRQGCQRLRR